MWKALRTAFVQHTTTLTAYRGSLRRLRPVTLDHDSKQDFEALKADSEAVRRLPSEHLRIVGEIRTETEAGRRLAAGKARNDARAVRKFIEDARAEIAKARRDVSLSFPDALDGVGKNGMITLGLLRVALKNSLAQASAAVLLSTYQAAFVRKDDPCALAEAEIIEHLAASPGLAANASDLPTLRQLRSFIADVQDLRLPDDLPDIDGLLAEVDRLDARADLINLLPLTSPESVKAFEQQRDDLLAAGEAPDAEDQAEVFARARAS
jgi:hypothetical protein